MGSYIKRLKSARNFLNRRKNDPSGLTSSLPKLVFDYLRIKQHFDMGFETYLRSGFESLLPISREKAEAMNRELERLGELSGKTPRAVLEAFAHAHTETNISFERYCSKNCVLENTYRILKIAVQKPDAEVLDMYSTVIARRMGISKEQALVRLGEIREKFKLSNLKIMNGCYYKLDDQQIAAALAAIPQRHDIWVGKYAAAKGEGNNIDKVRKKLDEIGENYGISADAVARRGYAEQTATEIKEDMGKRDAIELRKLKKLAKECGMTVWDFAAHEYYQRSKFGEAHSHYRKLKHYLRTDEELETFIGCADKQYFMHKYNTGMQGVQTLLDKGLFLEYFEQESGRHFWRNVPSASYESFRDFVTNYGGTRMFVKAARSSQGVGVNVVDPAARDLHELYDEYMEREELVVEECLIQHPDVAKFGGGCVNTLRTVTIFDQGEPHIIYCYIRIGEGEVFDNISQGGFKALVDLERGEIVSYGYSNSSTEEEVDPVTGEQILGASIPFCNEIKELAMRASTKAHELGVGFVGWDIAITADGPVLVEGNDNPALNGIEYIGLNRKTGHRAMLKPYLDEV